MARRSIELSLKADVGQLVAGLSTARAAINDTAKDTASFVRNNQQDMRTMGTALTTAGAALTAMTIGVTKAAIDWESSWADVQKVNDGTHDQMVRLEEDLREMARTIPATHEEIAAVAEAAGRLGVGVDDVADFSRVMIDLGNTTDLSAEQAATAIARFSNIAGTSFSDADRLGSTIVDLGNNFATTETEIVEMSQRLAAAGSQAGLSEGEIMGLATAMSSVGIEAQAGGTAMTQTFNEIDAAVREGGDSLEGWAELAGTSASEFADAWRNDPAEAIDLVIQGLAGVDESGGDVAGTLDDLGISGIRQADVLRRLASASDVAGDAMAMGNEAFAENSALSEEAAIRYETAAMQIKTAWGSIMDAAITAGSAIAPVVGDIAEGIGDLADWFGKLPDPVLQTVAAFSGVAGVAGLAAGGLLLLAPRAVETWDAFKRFSQATGMTRTLGRVQKYGPPAARALQSVGKYAGIAAIGMGALKGIGTLITNKQVHSIEEFDAAVQNLGQTANSDSVDRFFADWDTVDFLPGVKNSTDDVLDLDSAMERLAEPKSGGDKFNQWADEMFAWTGAAQSDLTQIEDKVESFGDSLSNMVKAGDAEAAAEAFNVMAESYEAAGGEAEELLGLMPGYEEALRSQADAAGVDAGELDILALAMGDLPPEMQAIADAADDAAQQDELTGALEEVGVAADGTVDSLSDYLDMLFETGLANQSAMQASASYQESLDAVGDAVDTINEDLGGMNEVFDETTGLFNDSEPAGRAAQDAFLAVAEGGMRLADSMAAAGDSQDDIQESLQGTYDDLISTAGEFGITGDAAEGLARHVLGIPDGVDIETWMDETAQDKANELGASLDAVPEGLTVITEMDDTARAKAFETGEAVDAIDGYKKVDVAISEDGTAGQVQSKIDSITNEERFVFVDDNGTTTTVQQQIINIDGVNRTVYVDDAGTIYATQSEINGISDGSSFIDVTDNSSAAGSRIDNAARPRTATLTVFESIIKGNSTGGRAGLAAGGRAPRSGGLAELSGGGRLPYTGLGTDQILGINALGHPTAMVDDLEWVVNRRSSDKYDGVISRINADHPSVQHLAHLRDGGRASGHEWTANSFANTAQIDYQKLAGALQGNDRVEQHMHLHTANASFTDGIDGFNRMNMAESRR